MTVLLCLVPYILSIENKAFMLSVVTVNVVILSVVTPKLRPFKVL
jgi:hypothetical protein